MPSKYKSKLPKQNIDLQSDVRTFHKNRPIVRQCTNCGTESMTHDQYSKCACGGTYQTFGIKK